MVYIQLYILVYIYCTWHMYIYMYTCLISPLSPVLAWCVRMGRERERPKISWIMFALLLLRDIENVIVLYAKQDKVGIKEPDHAHIIIKQLFNLPLRPKNRAGNLLLSASLFRSKSLIFKKITYFLYVFDSFPLFLCPRANCSCCSWLSYSFLKSDEINSLPLLFKKEQLWANQSCCSLQKSGRERFASIAHDKRATGEIRSLGGFAS